MTCTWPHRWPELLPRSRYQRPPGHGSNFMGNGLPSGIWLSEPSWSRTASKVISIGAAMSISLRTKNVCTSSCSMTSVAMTVLSWVRLRRRIRPLACLFFSAPLDSVELVAPEVLERFGPVIHGFQLLCIESVHALPATLVHGHDPDLAQDAEVLGHRRLRKSQGDDQRADDERTSPRQQLD